MGRHRGQVWGSQSLIRSDKVDPLLWTLSLTLVLLLTVAAAAPADAGQLRDRIGDRPDDLELRGSFASWVDWPADPDVYQALKQVYGRRLWRPLWVEDGTVRPEGLALHRRLRLAGLEGLDPDDYAPPGLPSSLHQRRPAWAGELDLVLSAALLTYARDLRGRAGVPAGEAGLPPASAVDPVAVLEGAARTADLERYLIALAPANRLYQDLRRMLLRHRAMAGAGGWPTLDDGPSLRLGSSGARVRALRARLQASHDLRNPLVRTDHFGADLDQAVRSFQARHGLVADGVVGRATLDALNVPLGQRIRQIRINMERMRRMPDDLGERHLLVNIPGFDLELRDEDRRALAMRVVVGRPSRPTRVFSSTLSHLVVNPYWHVPRQIAALDLLPKLQAAPDALIDQGIRILSSWSTNAVEISPYSVDWHAYGPGELPFKLRQDPGPANALGQIKFMLPNAHSIYLHDTPSQALFRRPVRAFSSGCVRLEAPVALAAYLYAHQGWQADDLRRTLASGRNQGIPLADSLPVHITYRTAWLGEDGAAHFRADVYGWDEALAVQLGRGPSAAEPAAAEAVP